VGCTQVRREIDILREGVNARFQQLHEEAVQIEKDNAEEIAAVLRGETPKPGGPRVVMYKDLGEDEPFDETATYVHEDEYKAGGVFVPADSEVEKDASSGVPEGWAEEDNGEEGDGGSQTGGKRRTKRDDEQPSGEE
jgi:hypothetical protein